MSSGAAQRRMDLARWAVRLAVGGAAGLIVALAVLSGSHGSPSGELPVLVAVPDGGYAGQPLAVPSAPGVTPASWDGQPVLVFAVNATLLDAVERIRGTGEATPSLDLGDGLRLFVLSARSTHLGCTVEFNTELGASKDVRDYDGDGLPDGRLLDACHLGQWDAFHRGEPVEGTPAPARLASLRIEVEDGRIVGHGFDGPTGATR